MKFSPDALKDEAKMRKFAMMLRTYLETGGGSSSSTSLAPTRYVMPRSIPTSTVTCW